MGNNNQGDGARETGRVRSGGLDPEMRRKFEEARQQVPSSMRPHIEAVRDSERLTQEDYSVRINTQIDTPIEAENWPEVFQAVESRVSA